MGPSPSQGGCAQGHYPIPFSPIRLVHGNSAGRKSPVGRQDHHPLLVGQDPFVGDRALSHPVRKTDVR